MVQSSWLGLWFISFLRMKAFKEEGDFRKGRCAPALSLKCLLITVLTKWFPVHKLGPYSTYWSLSTCRESFAIVKGAVHLLEDGERADLDEECSPPPASPVKEGNGASDTRRRQLRAMVEQLRPEDTIKLVRPCVSEHIIVQGVYLFQILNVFLLML